jgi:hypothetical protein
LIRYLFTKALIDTGSTVSTLSHTFYREHLSHLELKPLHSLLNIECADGKQLPCEGYIETFNSLSLSRIHLNYEYQGVVSFEVCKNLSWYLKVLELPYTNNVRKSE